MNFEEALAKAREGKVIRRHSWDSCLALMLFGEELEWVDATWTGPLRKDTGAAIENKDICATDWTVVEIHERL
jgi:hypothetical protein